MTSQRAAMRLEQVPEPIPILYLDDDAYDATQLQASMAKWVVNPVVTFVKAQDLYDYLDMNMGPFIVVVDLVLFDCIEIGGGYNVIHTLRQRPDINDTRSPIVAVTKTTQDSVMQERVREAGADAFLPKPLKADDLVSAIGRPGWFRLELSR
jgi:CheY-like chemotaxis protein